MLNDSKTDPERAVRAFLNGLMKQLMSTFMGRAMWVGEGPKILVLLDPASELVAPLPSSWGLAPTVTVMDAVEAEVFTRLAWARTGIDWPRDLTEQLLSPTEAGAVRLIGIVHQVVFLGTIAKTSDEASVALRVEVNPDLLTLARPSEQPRDYRLLLLTLMPALIKILVTEEGSTRRASHVLVAMNPTGWLMTRGKDHEALRGTFARWGTKPVAVLVDEAEARGLIEEIRENAATIDPSLKGLTLPGPMPHFRLLVIADRAMAVSVIRPSRDQRGVEVDDAEEPSIGDFLQHLRCISPSVFGKMSAAAIGHERFLDICREAIEAEKMRGGQRSEEAVIVARFGGKALERAFEAGAEATMLHIRAVMDGAPAPQARAPRHLLN